MAGNELLTTRRRDGVLPSLFSGERSPFSQFRHGMDRLIDDVFHPAIGASWVGATSWPSLEMQDGDKEVRIAAELPGMKEPEIDLTIDNGMLTISGERKSAEADRERGWSERYYGRFERRVSLPDGVDEDRAEASFRDGELTIIIPKTAAARKSRKVPIKGSARS